MADPTSKEALVGANVADFSVIRNKAFTVDENGLDSDDINFKFRGGLLKDLEGIITFMIRSSSGLRLRVDINNTVVLQERIVDGGFERMFQKVFPMSSIDFGGSPFTSDTPVATFTAIEGRGTFSDVVVWYRRDSG